MHSYAEPRTARNIKSSRKIPRLMHALIARHAETGDQGMRIGYNVLCRCRDGLRSLMAQACRNHPGLDTRRGFGTLDALRQPVDIGARVEPSADGVIRRYEKLRIDGVLPAQRQKIVFSEIRIILCRAEKHRSLIECMQERGEIVPDEFAILDECRNVGTIFSGFPFDQTG